VLIPLNLLICFCATNTISHLYSYIIYKMQQESYAMYYRDF
jgi:hypothetical protein